MKFQLAESFLVDLLTEVNITVVYIYTFKFNNHY